MTTVTLSVGQAVEWAPAPMGFAQIEELRRRNVRLVYRCRNGRTRHPIVSAAVIANRPLLVDLHNPYDRGVISRSKTFEVPA